MASVIAWKRYRVDQAQDLPDSSGYAWMRESMTRENKLALIVGFGLVLFMGILVSDHLSTARREASASLQMNTGLSRQAMVPGQGWLVYGVAQESSGEEVATALQIRQESAHPSEMERSIPIADPTEHSPHHVVGAGDTLQSICKRHYGTPHLDLALARYNRIPDPNRLAVRTRLLLPSALVLNGSDTSIISPRENAPIPKAAPVQEEPMGAYEVQSGDTLSELAQKLLGSARETTRLYELNRDVLRDQNDLRVGASLRYPLSN